jgi:hypothetical protein
VLELVAGPVTEVAYHDESLSSIRRRFAGGPLDVLKARWWTRRLALQNSLNEIGKVVSRRSARSRLPSQAVCPRSSGVRSPAPATCRVCFSYRCVRTGPACRRRL